MKTLIAATFAFLLGAVTSARIQNAHEAQVDNPTVATSSAYRDGAYLGRLDAVSGQPEHISTGRWARENDRRDFANGYRVSYEANQ